MSKLTELPQQLQHLSSLQKLKISDIPNLKELLQELCRLVNLERLKIEKCPRLVSFPDVGLPLKLKTLEIKICEGLQSLAAAAVPSEEIINNCLEVLSIYECSSFVKVSLPFATLKALDMSFCRRLEFPLSEEMKEHNYSTCIEVLSIIESCDLLKSLSLGLFPKLRDLYVRLCKDLETLLIPTMLQNLMNLEISHCPKVVSFPHGDGDGGGLLAIPNLMYLTIIYCDNLKWLPHQMHTLQSLQIVDCPEVESFPDEGLPSNLGRLHIINCNKLMKGRMRWDLRSLEYLRIGGEYEEEELESFPEECLLPTTLTQLEIEELPNLKSLNHKGLQHLTSLRNLKIYNCPKLRSLPEEGLPNSLSFLYINDCPKLQSLPEEGLPNSLSDLQIVECPLLKPRCQREKGKDWSKISRIRHIQFDYLEDIINFE